MVEVHRRLRRAAEIVAGYESANDPVDVLWRAWEVLNGLRSDRFPEELRSQFEFLAHEMSLRKEQEMTPREVRFLLGKIQELGLQWIEPPSSTANGEAGSSLWFSAKSHSRQMTGVRVVRNRSAMGPK